MEISQTDQSSFDEIKGSLLALDTSMTACSVALWHKQQIFSLHEITPRQQTKFILSMINKLLTSVAMRLEEVDAFVYGCGPGSFTGIRIANSVVQGLSYALSKPVISISSLALLAQTAWMDHGCNKALIAVDAQMGQVYWAAYRLNQQKCMELLGIEQVCKPQAVNLPEEGAWFGIGDGWQSYLNDLSLALKFSPNVSYSMLVPNAKALLPLAKIKFEQKKFSQSGEIIPVYLK